MSELINGRTPGEIKQALKHCNEPVPTACTGCPYNGTCLEHAPEIDALALIEHLEAERDAALAKALKWISVKERLPEKWQYADGTLVNHLIYMPEYGADVGNYFQPAKSWVCMGIPAKVTHWMPLPEPPKEGANGYQTD